MLEKRELALMEKEKEIRNVEKVMLELQVMMNEWIEQQARNMGSCELVSKWVLCCQLIEFFFLEGCKRTQSK